MDTDAESAMSSMSKRRDHCERTKIRTEVTGISIYLLGKDVSARTAGFLKRETEAVRLVYAANCSGTGRYMK